MVRGRSDDYDEEKSGEGQTFKSFQKRSWHCYAQPLYYTRTKSIISF